MKSMAAKNNRHELKKGSANKPEQMTFQTKFHRLRICFGKYSSFFRIEYAASLTSIFASQINSIQGGTSMLQIHADILPSAYWYQYAVNRLPLMQRWRPSATLRFARQNRSGFNPGGFRAFWPCSPPQRPACPQGAGRFSPLPCAAGA